MMSQQLNQDTTWWRKIGGLGEEGLGHWGGDRWVAAAAFLPEIFLLALLTSTYITLKY
jgi:hypothetical protein